MKNILNIYSVSHFVIAWKRFNSRMGNHFSAAITYFSFLSIIPVLMITFAIAGFVLSSKPELMDSIISSIVLSVKAPSLVTTLENLINTAVNQRTTVGVLGLGLACYSGLCWTGIVRDAVAAQFCENCEFPQSSENWFMLYLKNFGYFLSLLFIIGISVYIISFFMHFQVGFVNFFSPDLKEKISSLFFLTTFFLADLSFFLWIFCILPPRRPAFITVLRGALLAALFLQIVKAAMVYILPSMAKSPSGAMFGSTVGLLAFFNILARLILYCSAWIATAKENAPVQSPEQDVL